MGPTESASQTYPRSMRYRLMAEIRIRAMDIWQGSNQLTDVGSYGDKHDHSGCEEDLGCFIRLKGSSRTISLAQCHRYLWRSRGELVLFFQHDEHRFEEKARKDSYTLKNVWSENFSLAVRSSSHCSHHTGESVGDKWFLEHEYNMYQELTCNHTDRRPAVSIEIWVMAITW